MRHLLAESCPVHILYAPCFRDSSDEACKPWHSCAEGSSVGELLVQFYPMQRIHKCSATCNRLPAGLLLMDKFHKVLLASSPCRMCSPGGPFMQCPVACAVCGDGMQNMQHVGPCGHQMQVSEVFLAVQLMSVWVQRRRVNRIKHDSRVYAKELSCA